MSGEQLLTTLKDLHFPGIDALDPEALDWMFENEAIAPFLNWFCQSVSQSNLLQKQELDEFKALSEAGEVVLKGRQLEEALSNLDFLSDDSDSEESLREETEHLAANLQLLKKKRARLISRRNLLSTHHAELLDRTSKLNAVEAKVKNEYKTALAKAHAENARMNDCFDNLNISVTELSQLYQTPGVKKSDVPSLVSKSPHPSPTGSPAMFLSQVPVQQYYTAEEGFSSQLTAFTKKQFFQGISEMAGCGKDSMFEILNVSDPESLLVRGESHDVNIQDCKELARLQSLYIRGETDRLKALLEMKKLKNQFQTAKNILESLKTGTFSTDTSKNKEQLQKVQASAQNVLRDFQVLGENEVPKLIQKCKDAKVLRVLTGDYNLKLARQDYFTANQDKLINALVQQRSRNEFFTMALEVELQKHRELHHILTSLHNVLHTQQEQFQSRKDVMSDTYLTPARHKRETVDSTDKSTARLYHCLDQGGDNSEKQLFLTYSALVENAEKLRNKHDNTTRSLETSSSTGLDHVLLLDKNVEACEELLYAGSSTMRGQPVLTPRPIQENIIQLSTMLKQLEQGIKDVVKDIDNKKKLLKNDELLARERKLFTYFFTNPAKLHSTLEEISTRLDAESHMTSTQSSLGHFNK